MNLLLTSAGFTNPTIINALRQLTDRQFNKPFSELNLIFIPTAANVDGGDKDWLIEDLSRTLALGFKEMDILDFTGVPRDVWEPRIRQADILMFGGGNTFHLMHSVATSGLQEVLHEIIDDTVYVGISAGSMIAEQNVALSTSARMYSATVGEVTSDAGLGWVPFHIRPHLNSKWFPQVKVPYIEAQAKELQEPVYAIDDQSAVVVTGHGIEQKASIVSEGEWKLIDP